MKTIIVMRHAKAESESPTDNDFDRRLKKKGILAAKNFAEKIYHLGVVPQLIITSPVVRALSTAEILAEYHGLKEKMLLKNYLYNRLYSFEEIIKDIDTFYTNSNTALIVGHNPTISYLLQQINASTNELLGTSEAVVFDFDVDKWNEVNTKNSVKRCFIYRKD
jgi:phosphohistidine phosphatase